MTLSLPIPEEEAIALWADKTKPTAEVLAVIGLQRTTAIKRYGPRGIKPGPVARPPRKVRCPCCGTSDALVLKDSPLRLGAMEQSIFNAIRDSEQGLTAKQLLPKVYDGVAGGGPAWALNSIRVTIHTMNKKLAPMGLKLKCMARGGAYLLVELT